MFQRSIHGYSDVGMVFPQPKELTPRRRIQAATGEFYGVFYARYARELFVLSLSERTEIYRFSAHECFLGGEALNSTYPSFSALSRYILKAVAVIVDTGMLLALLRLVSLFLSAVGISTLSCSLFFAIPPPCLTCTIVLRDAPCLLQYPRSCFLVGADEEHPQEYSSIHSERFGSLFVIPALILFVASTSALFSLVGTLF